MLSAGEVCSVNSNTQKMQYKEELNFLPSFDSELTGVVFQWNKSVRY
jgi:hypothetical protein